MLTLDRIVSDPDVFEGQCSIRGEVSVSTILREFAAGRTIDEVLQRHPTLDREDVMQALRYNASQLSHWFD